VKARILNIVVAADILAFALITFGRSRRNETISGAAWSLEVDGKWQGKFFRPKIDWLFSWAEKDHCQRTWLRENKSQLWNGSNL